MEQQSFSWTCSVASFDWVCNATGVPMNRAEALETIGYPNCVNETYGLMSADCMIQAFRKVGFVAKQMWVTFEQAYSICRLYTGVINPIGQYHFMGIRGVQSGAIWVANSALGYRGVYETLDINQFNSLGPIQVIYCESYI